MRNGIRIIVCGGRDHSDRGEVNELLDAIHSILGPITELAHGDAPGADTLAKEWAEANGVLHDPFPANWNKHGKAAGPIRNQQMAMEGADYCVAFPGGRGTKDMTRRAEMAGIKVITIFDKVRDFIPARTGPP